jgi:hypothetical protein
LLPTTEDHHRHHHPAQQAFQKWIDGGTNEHPSFRSTLSFFSFSHPSSITTLFLASAKQLRGRDDSTDFDGWHADHRQKLS